MTGDRSQLTNFVLKFLGTVKFGNDQVAKIMGYGDYQIGNVTISRVYYMEGLRHNLFSVGQFYDSDLEVAFRKYTCFVRNMKGVDLLSGSRGTNLYSLSIGDMMASSPICLLHGLVRGFLRLKFEKDHLCSACVMGKSKKQSHKPKFEDSNQEKLYLLHMDFCGPMRVASVNGKRYILVIMDDYSRFTWVKFLASKDEALDFIIKFLKMIQILHDIKPDLSYLHIFGALCYPYNDSENLGKLQAKAAIGLFPNPPSSAPFVPPSRHEWDLVFQPVFDKFFSPPPSVASPVPIEEALAPVESTGSPSSTTVDQDAPLPSTSQTIPQSQSQTIPLSAKEESHDLEVAHMSNDPYFGIPIPETVFKESSSSDVIFTTMHTDALISEHLSK
ncbi:retrovirus-related pol polyprotein from transposon TNT 1-94 [Tanacetum coccineum]